MTNRTITLSQINLDVTYSVKDNSVRGCHTESGHNLKVGDKIVIDNYFHEIIEEPAETRRTAEEITADIIEYFEENEDIFNSAIEELDSYNGYLNDDRYYEMDLLNDFYHGTAPIDILQRAYFGHDADTWTTDSSGNKTYGEFNPNREYFTYNGYGNLISTDYKDYSGKLDEWAIETMLENREYIDTIEFDDELRALFEELEDSEEE